MPRDTKNPFRGGKLQLVAYCLSQLWPSPARGADIDQSGLFSYVWLERRVPSKHPLRRIRALLDEALEAMHRDFERV